MNARLQGFVRVDEKIMSLNMILIYLERQVGIGGGKKCPQVSENCCHGVPGDIVTFIGHITT